MNNKLILPEKIHRHIKDMSCEQNNGGCSKSSVYKFYSPDKALYLKFIGKAGINQLSEDLEREYKVISWLQGKLPAPEIIEWVSDERFNYLLMTEIKGASTCDDYYLQTPQKMEEAVSVLASGIKLLKSVDITDCPINAGVEMKLKIYEKYMNLNLNNENYYDWRETTKQRFKNPRELLDWLIKNKPSKESEIYFTHGDYCLPNIFGIDKNISGFIDLASAGVGDIWTDITLCVRSMRYNFNSFDYDKMFFEQIETDLDEEKFNYYLLLDELA
ncbi:MAG: aminoglycoside 3'-phosphotransferase [Oscillospiraceae bacterium]|nr:aminoglycoside 3'-phosphotransferase [Oscillospiraceae bacterium]